MRRVLAGVALLFYSSAVLAEPLHVRLMPGNAYSRIVASDPGATIAITHRDDRLLIASNPSSGLAVAGGHAALVLRTSVRPGEVILQLAPGSSIRQFKRGPARVIDIFASIPASPNAVPDRHDAPVVHSAASELIPGLPGAFAAKIENLRATSTDQAAAPKLLPSDDDHHLSAQKTNTPAQPDPSVASSSTQSIAAAPVASSGSLGAILLPFSSDVGVAALRRDGTIQIYFDEARPVDLSTLQTDPVFGRATVTMRASLTELTLPLRPDQSIDLSRQPAGWRLAVEPVAPDLTPIVLRAARDELLFLMPTPGKVLTATDPATGALLMIGTDREARSGFVPAYRSDGFVIDRSEVGLVIEPLSDRLSLRPVKAGFSLYRDDGQGLDVPVQNSVSNSLRTTFDLTRSLDFPIDPTQRLNERLDRQLLAAAKAPPRARLAPRTDAARTMIALGLAREARTLLRVTFADDPTAADDPRTRMLQAVAEFLTDPNQGASLDGAGLPTSDETRLWRALADRADPAAKHADAAAISGLLPLILSYPDHLRDVVAGLAAPILLAGSSRANLAALEQLPSTPRTVVAKALGLELQGDATGALSRLDDLTTARDLKTSSDAILGAALLRSKLGRLTPASAADVLAAHRLDWRATGQEGEALMREADLRRQAGQWLQAFELWREVERRFPDFAEAAQSDILATLERMAEPGMAARMPPADFVLVVTDCARELASHEQVAAELAPILADRLEALDLPGRATEVLRQAMQATGPGIARAELGSKLAVLLLAQDDPEGARAALVRSEATGLSAEMVRARHLLLARVLERQGDHDAALAAIGTDDGAAAQDARAIIFADCGRWHDAKLALEPLADHFPSRGTLARGQADQAIRLAAAASRDGDTELLMRLARAVDGRFPDPDEQQTFSLMTAPLTQRSGSPAPSNAG